MKKLLILFWLGWFISPVFAQKIIEKNLPVANGQTVNLNFRFADSIAVQYWDKAEVAVRIAVVINNGRLNNALLVTTTNTADEVGIKTDYDKELIKQGQIDDCPDERSKNYNRDGASYYVCSDIDYQVYLPRGAKLKLNTINGNITIKGASESVDAKTISGYIDMNWPRSKGANLAMKTITGEVYSDLAIDFTGKRPKHPIVGYKLEGNINGGGPAIRLESISNDIYLRNK